MHRHDGLLSLWMQNQNQKCIYSILTKSVYKVTMKRFGIGGPLLIKTSLVAYYIINNSFHITS